MHEINSPQSCLVAENRSGAWKGYPWMSTVQQNPPGSSSLTASSMVLANSSMATCSRRFCHPSGKTLYLIMVDAHSKWPEVIGPMKTTTADSTINAMRNIFARYGLPTQVVSDNGPPFQSAEYEEFLRQNGIQRILVSPYHPSSNGLAEPFAQTIKYAMESSVNDPASSIHRWIQNFLLSYRSTPHATTSSSPAKLFLQRELRTPLSILIVLFLFLNFWSLREFQQLFCTLISCQAQHFCGRCYSVSLHLL